VIDIPKGGAIIRDIKVPSSNAAEIEVVFKPESGDNIVKVTGAPTSLPKDQFPTDKVSEIIIKVIKTSDGKAPEDVTLSIIACAEGVTPGTTARPGEISHPFTLTLMFIFHPHVHLSPSCSSFTLILVIFHPPPPELA
jgi:hypothetical protein